MANSTVCAKPIAPAANNKVRLAKTLDWYLLVLIEHTSTVLHHLRNACQNKRMPVARLGNNNTRFHLLLLIEVQRHNVLIDTISYTHYLFTIITIYFQYFFHIKSNYHHTNKLKYLLLKTRIVLVYLMKINGT